MHARETENPLLDESKFTTLGLRRLDDQVDLLAHKKEGGRDGHIAKRFDLVERYREGHAALVVNVSAMTDPGDYDVVLLSVESRGADLDLPADLDAFRKCASSREINGGDPRMERVTELVQGPEEVIPSFVWLERAKHRHNLLGKIAAASFDGVIESGRIISDREVGLFGFDFPGSDGGSVPSLIERGPQGIDSSVRDVSPILFGDALVEMDFEKFLGSIRINLSSLSVTYAFDVGKETLLKPLSITLAAL